MSINYSTCVFSLFQIIVVMPSPSVYISNSPVLVGMHRPLSPRTSPTTHMSYLAYLQISSAIPREQVKSIKDKVRYVKVVGGMQVADRTGLYININLLIIKLYFNNNLLVVSFSSVEETEFTHSFQHKDVTYMNQFHSIGLLADLDLFIFIFFHVMYRLVSFKPKNILQ